MVAAQVQRTGDGFLVRHKQSTADLMCVCEYSPLCRHHHRCKQAEGWQLSMPEPGVLVWHTPTGRSYTTTPTPYAL